MRTSLKILAFTLLLGLVGVLPPLAQAWQGASAFRIKDDAKLFKDSALDRAEKEIETIKKRYNKDLRVETYNSIPPKFNENIAKFAVDRYEAVQTSGVLILITKSPAKLQVEAGKQTRKKAFTPANETELATRMLEKLKNREPDEALLDGVGYVERTFEKTIGRIEGGNATTRTGSTSPKSQPKEATGGMFGNNIWSWVCIGGVALLALWVVVGLFRAMTGGGGRPLDRPPGNYAAGPQYGAGGPAPGYYPQQSSGGGFLSSMLGGMLGAGAGMYVYDSFFRGGSSSPGTGWTPSAQGSPPPVSDDRTAGGGAGGDWGSSTPASSDAGAGGDWGAPDKDAGGDWGAPDKDAGGDWGGGGGGDDAGGDWGGGGDGGGGDGAGGDW